MRFRSWAVTVLFFLLQGCGGSSGGGGGTPNPPGGGGGTSQNPCPASALTAETFSSRLQEERRADKKRAIDGDSRFRVFDSLSLHREAQQWREREGRSAPAITQSDAPRAAVRGGGELATLPCHHPAGPPRPGLTGRMPGG